MSRIFLWFLSLYVIILLQICLKKKTQRLRHFTLVWCYLTLNCTQLHHSVWLYKPVVLNLCRGFLYIAKGLKKRQQGVIQYFSWCYLTLTWCNVLITPGWCRVNTNMVYNYTALGVTVTSSLFLCRPLKSGLIFMGDSLWAKLLILNSVGYSYLPWHDCPSPVYPSLQVQIWEPFALLQ